MKHLLVAVILAFATPAVAAPVTIRGSAGITDGDTIRVGTTRVRLLGMDAPESHQSCTRQDGSTWQCGQEAARRLQGLIAGRPVNCVGTDRDRYHRLLAACSVGGKDIGAWMVSHGWAVAYRRYSEAYVPEENRTKSAHLGLWGGTFDWPWDWRQTHPR